MVGFYRDGIGLPQIGEFRDHEGYDGVFLALPGTGAHLELTAGGEHAAPRSHPESLVVKYLGDRDAVASVAARLDAEPVPPANPYWAEHGLTLQDPDGFRVVLVPERSLTPSERRVVELAAAGGTNRQIAQTLFVTDKTVETHLGRSYRKLDISSRRQLPDVLARTAG